MKEVKSPKKPLIYYYVIVLLVLAAFVPGRHCTWKSVPEFWVLYIPSDDSVLHPAPNYILLSEHLIHTNKSFYTF